MNPWIVPVPYQRFTAGKCPATDHIVSTRLAELERINHQLHTQLDWHLQLSGSVAEGQDRPLAGVVPGDDTGGRAAVRGVPRGA